MITKLTSALLSLALFSGPVQTQGKAKSLSGDYEVTFEEVTNNCTTTGMNLKRGVFTLKHDLGKRSNNLEVSFPMTPVMYGTADGEGKVRARAKLGGTGIQGVQGKFSVAGRVDGDKGVIQLVFIAEYYQGKKPLCTQSWNARGLRADTIK